MVPLLLLGTATIITNVIVQAYGNVFWIKRITPNFKSEHPTPIATVGLRLLIFSFLFFTLLHGLQTLLWALVYRLVPETSLIFSSFSEAWYFSLVTFTTLGYGDVLLTGHWRLLSGIQAINGIMLIGWSTAMMYSLIQQIYKSLNSI